MRKKVVLIPIGGLCNRMRVINSAYKTFGDSRKITVVWIKNSELCAKANDFFELPSDIKVINFNLFSFPQKLIWKVVRKVIIGHPNYIHQLDFIHEQERNKEKRDILELFEGKLTICEGCEEFAPFDVCDIFTPKKEYIEMAKRIEPKSEYVAFHIRRTDNRLSTCCSTDDDFAPYIAREISNKHKIFLSTDDVALRDRLNTKYPGLFIYQKFIQCDRNNFEGMETAFIDLLCLSHAKKIYGSLASSFSEIASKMNGADLVLVGEWRKK